MSPLHSLSSALLVHPTSPFWSQEADLILTSIALAGAIALGPFDPS